MNHTDTIILGWLTYAVLVAFIGSMLIYLNPELQDAIKQTWQEVKGWWQAELARRRCAGDYLPEHEEPSFKYPHEIEDDDFAWAAGAMEQVVAQEQQGRKVA